MKKKRPNRGWFYIAVKLYSQLKNSVWGIIKILKELAFYRLIHDFIVGNEIVNTTPSAMLLTWIFPECLRINDFAIYRPWP